MFTHYDDLEQLMIAVEKDKAAEGVNSFVANRYPVRFVLFDSFDDCQSFVGRITRYADILRISTWMDADYPDVMITYSMLADKIKAECIAHDKDIVVAPFSELARFYDNKKVMEFDSLISTIKSIENSKEGYECHHRMYVPIVGLDTKMSRFHDDSQTIIWQMKGTKPGQEKRMILTDGTCYDVKGLESKYTVITNVTEWLSAWDNNSLMKTIICSSPAIYANAKNAQPDNAFTFFRCPNAYTFLTKGLELPMENMTYHEGDDDYWKQLAEKIDIKKFNFAEFINKEYDIHMLGDYNVFVKSWFEFNNLYMHWLLSAYYTQKFCDKGYICRVLHKMDGYTNRDFVTALEFEIFNCADAEQYLDERRAALQAAGNENVAIGDEKECKLKRILEEKAASDGYSAVLKYMSMATNVERSLLIEWVGKGIVSVSDIKDIYPALYSYMQPSSFGDDEWINRYIDAYKQAKIANVYTDDIAKQIAGLNDSAIKFNNWYQTIKTTRTALDEAKDIDRYFWIDGLGIDWIPFVMDIISEKNSAGCYLNDVKVCKALLPTVTRKNKTDLEKLAQGHLPKTGDIDEAAHESRKYPQYIIDDMYRVRKAILDAVDKYSGSKIAIVSDHGISFLSQLCKGLNIKGFTSDHGGRLAMKDSGNAKNDDNYIVLDDGKTVCALRHDSLCAKIPDGCGCHGGCTPEEVLVPVFVISGKKNEETWTATLITTEIKTTSPYAKFRIKGDIKGGNPIVIYDGKTYELTRQKDGSYRSARLKFNSKVREIILRIGNRSCKFNVTIKQEVEEDDIFADF